MSWTGSYVPTSSRRLGETSNSDVAFWVACHCVLAPGAKSDDETVVRLAELGVRGNTGNSAYGFNRLGAALYRAGRFQDAIVRLEEAIRNRQGDSRPEDWVFLAMAYHHLGHRDEARRFLERLRVYKPSVEPNMFWDEVENSILRTEAESVILYDPIFPADPFAK